MTTRYPLEDNFGYLLNRCASEMAARFERELARHNVTLAQWGAMIAINAGRGGTPTELAKSVGIDKGATTRLIARMVDKGLVVRTGSETDGRSVRLALSDEAERLMPMLADLSRTVNRDALALLDAEDGAQLKNMLADLLDRMTASKD